MISAIKEDIREYMVRMEKAMDILNQYRVSMAAKKGAGPRKVSISKKFSQEMPKAAPSKHDVEVQEKKNCNVCALI